MRRLVGGDWVARAGAWGMAGPCGAWASRGASRATPIHVGPLWYGRVGARGGGGGGGVVNRVLHSLHTLHTFLEKRGRERQILFIFFKLEKKKKKISGAPGTLEPQTVRKPCKPYNTPSGSVECTPEHARTNPLSRHPEGAGACGAWGV